MLLGIPLLFAAAWCRLEVSHALAHRDDLLARREELQHSIIWLTNDKTRLATWESLAPRAETLGLREPRAWEVKWVAVRKKWGWRS
jgi:hypothetical protein